MTSETYKDIGPVLRYPLPAPRRTTQYFGERAVDYSRYGLYGHNGWDFSAKVGTPVRAPIAGQVWAYTDPGYGLAVEIWYPRIGSNALYKVILAHGSEFAVADGSLVEADQVVMLSGNTGNTTGPHLHFGLKLLRNGARNPGYRDWVDPRPYMA